MQSLLSHGHIEFGSAKGVVATKKAPVSRETHRVKITGGRKVLERVRFHCGRA